MIIKYIPDQIKMYFFFQMIGIDGDFLHFREFGYLLASITCGQITWDQEENNSQQKFPNMVTNGGAYVFQFQVRYFH